MGQSFGLCTNIYSDLDIMVIIFPAPLTNWLLTPSTSLACSLTLLLLLPE